MGWNLFLVQIRVLLLLLAFSRPFLLFPALFWFLKRSNWISVAFEWNTTETHRFSLWKSSNKVAKSKTKWRYLGKNEKILWSTAIPWFKSYMGNTVPGVKMFDNNPLLSLNSSRCIRPLDGRVVLVQVFNRCAMILKLIMFRF